MSENPLQSLCQTFEKVSSSFQHHFSDFIGHLHRSPPFSAGVGSSLSVSSSSKIQPAKTASFIQPGDILLKAKSAPVTKEELGRATWTFLHTLAAQDVVNVPVTISLHLTPHGMFSQLILLLAKGACEQSAQRAWKLQHDCGIMYPDNPTRQQKKDVKELMGILSRMYPCKECADHFKEVLRANPVQAGSHAEFSQWLCHVHNVVNRSLGKPIFPCERVDARWGKLDCVKNECDILGTSNFGED